jgi:molybdopterin converting factor small subunit
VNVTGAPNFKGAPGGDPKSGAFGRVIMDDRRTPGGQGAVTISIHIPGVLRNYCGGATRLSLPAADVRGALEELERRHPALHRCVCDETGKVRRHVNVFVNSDHMLDREGLDTLLVSGDVLTILPAVSGG